MVRRRLDESKERNASQQVRLVALLVYNNADDRWVRRHVSSHPLEMVTTVFIMIFGSIIFAIIFGTITNVLSDLDSGHKKYSEKIESLQLFLSSQHIPVSLQRRIFQYYNFLWDRKKSFKEATIMDELPLSLYYEVAYHIHQRMFNHSRIWEHCPKTFLNLIMGKLHEADGMVYLPMDYVFFEGDELEFFYFIEKGLITLYKGEIPVQERGDCSYFGDIGLLDNLKEIPPTELGEDPFLSWGTHHVGARASHYCDVHLLSVHELMEIFEAGSTTEGAAGQFKELVHIASERRKDRVDKFIASVDLFSVSKGLDDIDDDIPHTETPAQDEDSLGLAIAFCSAPSSELDVRRDSKRARGETCCSGEETEDADDKLGDHRGDCCKVGSCALENGVKSDKGRGKFSEHSRR